MNTAPLTVNVKALGTQRETVRDRRHPPAKPARRNRPARLR